MADKTVKIIGKHNKDCFALKAFKDGRWHTPWGPVAWGDHGSPIVKTERRYGKKGRTFPCWLRYVCNDTSCKAELHINTDAILSIFQKKL